MLRGLTKKTFRAATSIFIAGGLVSWFYQAMREKTDRVMFPPPGMLVDIGGRKIHVLRSGSQKPVVVIMPALGAFALEWANVQKYLAADATVYVIDRAGIGWSDVSRGPQTPRRIAQDLHALLNGLGLVEPVVLVGHSYGGLAVRLYAAQHPERVKALMLMESSHEDQRKVLSRFPGEALIDLYWGAIKTKLRWLGLRRMRTELNVNNLLREKEQSYTKEFRDAGLSRYLGSVFRRTVAQEFIGMSCGNGPVRHKARDFKDLPITIVTGGIGGRTRKGWHNGWLKCQNSFLRLSTNTRQVWAPNDGHHVNVENPELVAQAIKDLINR